ncbi:MAG: hypothetical protein IJX17_06795 [Clostridia bacterium]|nr:hypothetical protein [Clostridia bacterium]
MIKKICLSIIFILACVLSLSACDTKTNQNNNSNNNNNGNNNPTTEQVCNRSFGDWVVFKQATCKEDGILTRLCSLCLEVENTTITKTENHTEVIDSEIPATCENTGLTQGKHCSVCSLVIEKQVVVPKISHTFDNNEDETCNKCDYIRDLTCNHTNTIKLPAVSEKCLETGLTEGKKCADCETILIQQTIIPAKGHTNGQWIIDKNATESESGSKHQVCSVCNETIKTETIPANYNTDYTKYDEPESSDFARWDGSKVVKGTNTTTEEIKWIQSAINYLIANHNLNTPYLVVDGSFGPKCKTTTLAFQKAYGLTADGSFGPICVQKMKEILGIASDFTQKNILQVNAKSSDNYISGDWYSYKPNDNSKTIRDAGCGIVALVSAIYNLGGSINESQIGNSIKEVINWAYSKNYWKNEVINRNLFNKSDDNFGTKYNFTISSEIKGTSTDEKLINHIKNGGTAVAHVYGHFITIVDYKEENGVGKFLVFDPAPGGGTNWNSLNRKTSDGKAITTANGNWFTLDELKNDGGTKGRFINNEGKEISYGYENIEIDAYWLVSKA